ncbi:transcription termination factor NusA [Sulfoacidibacillus thermotolerans]|uniref:Transcription termination/antitermination protein NusA n=1 Tax=Sulfoacidibacillus thermotolerans TaxID=1765684 RepID=A0A2U3DAB0_SULT2|nr:transcription termination factor NusA [Sulfoacidibacillus thermotolerans]PWI58217.1 transcription termination/antitermination protein NusA [Sulfoacidibacillus thermotolerans]
MNADFIEALDELEKERGISSGILIEAIEAALISAYKRNFNSAQNVRVEIDRLSGSIHVYARKTVVETPRDPRLEMSLDAAMDISASYRLGDIVEVEVTPREFGRIAAQTAKQVVTQRIREAERGIIYNAYADMEEDIVSGVITRQDGRYSYVDLERTEALLAVSEQIPSEKLELGDRVRAYILRVEKTTKGPQILLSRIHPGLLRRLLELEVPEIYEGVVEVKSVAREAGSRSKVAVYSHNADVDPIGACVGPKGMRIQSIVTELRGEKIDVIEWSNDPAIYVASALSPAKVVDVEVHESEKVARVIVPDHQLSLAIGKEGQNARLAAKLTGWKIDIKSESQVGRSSSVFSDLERDAFLRE